MGSNVRACRKVVGTVTEQEHEAEDPNEVHKEANDTIASKIAVRFLVDSVVKDHQAGCVNVVDGFDLGELNGEAVHKANRASPPGNVAVDDYWWQDK